MTIDNDTTIKEALDQSLALLTKQALDSLDDMTGWLAKVRESVEAGRYVEASGWLSTVLDCEADAIYMLAAKERHDAVCDCNNGAHAE